MPRGSESSPPEYEWCKRDGIPVLAYRIKGIAYYAVMEEGDQNDTKNWIEYFASRRKNVNEV